MTWVNLDDVYVSTSGGTINGNLAVNGSLTCKNGSTTYNVGSQLATLGDSVSRVVVSNNVWMTIKFNGNIRFAYMIGAFDNGIAPGENVKTITLPAAGYAWDGYGVNTQLLSNVGSSTPYFDNIAMITRSHTSSKFDLVAWNSSSTNVSYRFCVVVTYYDQYSG